jgi:hypothetical protein
VHTSTKYGKEVVSRPTMLYLKEVEILARKLSHMCSNTEMHASTDEQHDGKPSIFDVLPNEMISHILKFIPAFELRNSVAKVSIRMANLVTSHRLVMSKEPSLWINPDIDWRDAAAVVKNCLHKSTETLTIRSIPGGLKSILPVTMLKDVEMQCPAIKKIVICHCRFNTDPVVDEIKRKVSMELYNAVRHGTGRKGKFLNVNQVFELESNLTVEITLW